MPLKACILFSLSRISLRYINSRFRQSQKFRSLGEKNYISTEISVRVVHVRPYGQNTR